MSPQGRTRTPLLLVVVISTVIFIRWHSISEGRSITYFDLVGGLALTASFTLALYSWQVARFRQKEAENSKELLEKEIAKHIKTDEVRSRLVSIIETTTDFAGSANPDGRAFFINKAGRKMLGIGEDEDIADIRIEDTHPAWANEIIRNEAIPTAIRDGVWRGEIAMLSLDGREIPVLQVLMAHKRPDGSLDYFSTIVHDITERKRLEEALKASETYYRSVFDNSLYPIAVGGADYKFQEVNSAYCKLMEYDKEELVGNMTFADVTSPDDMPENLEMMGKLIRRELDHFIIEKRYVTKSGRIIDALLFLKGIYDDAGKYTNGVAAILDITDRKRLEEELKESEAAYRSLVEHLPATTWVYIARLDDIASTVYVGPQVKTLGFSKEEWVNARNLWSRQLHPDDRERVLSEFKRNRTSGKAFSLEYRLLTRSNEILWFKDEAAVVNDDNGNPLFFQGIMSDITEQKNLEEQLRQSQKMEAVGQLAAGIAHDFNNILTTVTGYAEFLLMKMKEEDPLRNHIREIAAAGEKGIGLVKNILTFSRKEEFSPIPMDMNDIILVMKDSLLKLIGEDLELRTELSDESLMVFADAIQMEQMLINIAANARDAISDVGSLLITTSSVKLDEKYINNEDEYYPAGMYALISVSDTGVGMEEAVRKRIFEPFYTTKDVGKGTGLGLSMVYGIVKRHKGFIDVVSEPGRGTTFNIYLPLTAGTVKMEELPASSDSAIEGGHTETVLLAEDENALRLATATYLNELGYNCIEAVNGEDAVARFMENKESIQLIILDVVMPRKNGKDVYEEIRKVRPDIKVIFSSGYTVDILEQKGISWETADFIKKPFSPETLHNKIREVLERSS